LSSYDFDQNEQVLCMTSVNLESPSVASGFRDFIAVGTGFDFAEDRACRGNVRTLKSPKLYFANVHVAVHLRGSRSCICSWQVGRLEIEDENERSCSEPRQCGGSDQRLFTQLEWT
jgi:hypothetical protein